MPPDLRPVMGPAPAAHALLTHREQERSTGMCPALASPMHSFAALRVSLCGSVMPPSQICMGS